ncbi:MAG: heavy-metal-associated domain-containing protein [Polyangiaceae bacterium]|nr:heavy-metal-associated domain-containing protein [Polyangiaceae bacterium]
MASRLGKCQKDAVVGLARCFFSAFLLSSFLSLLAEPIEAKNLEPTPTVPLEKVHRTKVTLALQGMHCAGCSIKIRKALLKLNGVLSLSDGASKKELVVHFDDRLIHHKDLIKAVEEIGYGAKVVPST